MTALERSTARLLANPAEADFSDVRRVLEGHGWVQARQQGSHVHFTKEGERTITIPLRGAWELRERSVQAPGAGE